MAKTSGSKGMQIYVPLNSTGRDAHTHDHAAQFALAVGQLLEQQHPDGVTTTMAKVERPGKVFVDWSQNARFKTTICVYSLRARENPTVSTPVTWDEVSDAADGVDPLRFESSDVLDRTGRSRRPVGRPRSNSCSRCPDRGSDIRRWRSQGIPPVVASIRTC